jgi:hypothetical protein
MKPTAVYGGATIKSRPAHRRSATGRASTARAANDNEPTPAKVKCTAVSFTMGSGVAKSVHSSRERTSQLTDVTAKPARARGTNRLRSTALTTSRTARPKAGSNTRAAGHPGATASDATTPRAAI